MKYVLALLALLLPMNGYAANFNVDYANSTITFKGEHAGSAFDGVFKEWNATILFDSKRLSESFIEASIKLSSAKTGNLLYDGTLPQSDWFDTKNHPEGLFRSKEITQDASGKYHANGTLTLRDITNPAAFHFNLSERDDGSIKAEGDLVIDRLSYNIGKGSDPKAEWVSNDIVVHLIVFATPMDPMPLKDLP